MKKAIGYTLCFALACCMQLQAAAPVVKVFKTRTCGCCSKWVEHLKANGFTPVVTEVPSTAEYRAKYGVPEQLQSCHTAIVEGHPLEGHVPAEDIHRLLKTGKKGTGLAVPGMPMGSPGMEQGERHDPYSVVLFDSEGRTSVYQKH
jgi:Predicted metal-binding protein